MKTPTTARGRLAVEALAAFGDTCTVNVADLRELLEQSRPELCGHTQEQRVAYRRRRILQLCADQRQSQQGLADATGWSYDGFLREDLRALDAEGLLVRTMGRHGGYDLTDHGRRELTRQGVA